MTKIEQAALEVTKAEQRKRDAFHVAGLAREEAKRALKHLHETIARERGTGR